MHPDRYITVIYQQLLAKVKQSLNGSTPSEHVTCDKLVAVEQTPKVRHASMFQPSCIPNKTPTAKASPAPLAPITFSLGIITLG
jgi:hypothetical protein